MNILIMGGPGAGKGTMSLKIAEKFGILHISTGDIFRSEMAKQTPLGMEAKKYVDQGFLVPDEVTNLMVKSFLEKQDMKEGYLLDGYPRTLAQAEAFDELVKNSHLEIDKVLSMEISFDKLAIRITGRRLCRNCDAIYHMTYHPPKVDGVCDVCGGELYQRKDDTIEGLKVRLEEYTKNAIPVLEHYKDKVSVINADQDMEDVWQEVLVALGDQE